MNNNMNFVNAFVDAIRVWNLEMDKEPTYGDDMDQKAVNRFIYEDLISGGN